MAARPLANALCKQLILGNKCRLSGLFYVTDEDDTIRISGQQKTPLTELLRSYTAKKLIVMARYSHNRIRWIRYDITQNITIRYDTICKSFAVCKNCMLSVTNYSYVQTHHKKWANMLCVQQQCRGDNQLGSFERTGYIASGRQTPPRLPTHALPALSAISSSTQHNACNATYAKSGQRHGWNLSRDICIKLESCFGPCVACVSLAYGAVRQCCPHVDVWYGDVRRRTSTCVNVRRCTVP